MNAETDKKLDQDLSRDTHKTNAVKDVKKPVSSFSKKLWTAACMALLATNPLRLVNAEEASIMAGATVPTNLSGGSDGDEFIHGSYKSFIKTSDNSNPVDAKVNLS